MNLVVLIFSCLFFFFLIKKYKFFLYFFNAENDTLVTSMSSQKDSFEDVEVINEQPTTSAKHNPNR